MARGQEVPPGLKRHWGHSGLGSHLEFRPGWPTLQRAWLRGGQVIFLLSIARAKPLHATPVACYGRRFGYF